MEVKFYQIYHRRESGPKSRFSLQDIRCRDFEPRKGSYFPTAGKHIYSIAQGRLRIIIKDCFQMTPTPLSSLILTDTWTY